MNTGTRVGVVFALAVAIIAALGVNSYLSTRRLLEANRQVQHTHQLIETLERVLSMHKDAETGQRGYVLTGDEHYLEPFNTANGQIQTEINSLKELAAVDPAQQEALGKIQTLSDAKLAELRQTIALRKESGLEAALQAVRTDRGRQIMRELRQVIAGMQERETALLEARQASAAASARRTLLTLGIWTPASLLLLAILGVIVVGKVRFGGPAAPSGAPVMSVGSIALRYGLAVVAVAVAVAMRFWLLQTFASLPLFLTLYPAVLLVATLAGGGPGIFATLLAALATDYFFLPPTGTLVIASATDIVALAIFTATSLLICILGERLRRTRWIQAVAAQKELLAVTLASIGDAVLLSDVAGRVTFLNAEAERLTGWTLAEAQGQPVDSVFRIINERSRQPVESPIDKVLRLGAVAPLANHTLLIARDGRETAIDDSGAPVREAQGAVQGVVLIFRDISGRKAVEIAQTRLAAIVESSDDAILSKGLDGTILTWNKAAQRLFGYQPQEIVGKPITLLLPPDRLQEEEEILARLVQGQEVEHLDTVRLARDGRRVDVSVTVSPLKDHDGRVIGASKIIRDITGAKAAEAALRESEAKYRNLFQNMTEEVHFWKLVRDEQGQIKTWQLVDANPPTLKTWGRKSLEEIKGKTTDEIFGPGAADHFMPVVRKIISEGVPHAFEDYFPNLDRYFHFTSVPFGEYFITTGADITSIKKAQKLIEQQNLELTRSNTDLQQFAYVASHDLQEPLRMVTGYLQLLERRYKDKLDTDAREFIDFAVDGATRMSRLITDLLDYSRVGSRGKPPELVAVEDVLQRAVENLQAAIRESAAQITHSPLPTVRADATQLVQLLQNLLGNAMKFRAPDRPVCICIAAEKKDDDWLFSVKDNGIGIEPQYADKIFRIFQRLHGRSDYPGTGIGLAICKRIVERHGGQIWLESQLGQGATFFFTLPSTERTL